jgi:Spy/CpxP family protein refolding chaperone
LLFARTDARVATRTDAADPQQLHSNREQLSKEPRARGRGLAEDASATRAQRAALDEARGQGRPRNPQGPLVLRRRERRTLLSAGTRCGQLT